MSDMEEVNSGPKPGAAAPAAALEGLMAEAVIGRTLLRIAQDVIGLVDFLETLLGRAVARLGIGMETAWRACGRRFSVPSRRRRAQRPEPHNSPA